jgi:hypothetical protein
MAAAMRRIGLDLEAAQTARLRVLQRARTHGIELVTGIDAGAAHGPPPVAACPLGAGQASI